MRVDQSVEVSLPGQIIAVLACYSLTHSVEQESTRRNLHHESYSISLLHKVK